MRVVHSKEFKPTLIPIREVNWKPRPNLNLSFLLAECFTDQHITVSAATESIQFDGRALSLGTGAAPLHVPSSPAQAPSATTTPLDINLDVLRSASPTSQSSSPAPSQIQAGTISPSTTDQRSTNDGEDVKSITQLLQQSAQQLFKTQLDMPPPTSPSPRKRRRKREDPQSCLTNSEVRTRMNTLAVSDFLTSSLSPLMNANLLIYPVTKSFPTPAATR